MNDKNHAHSIFYLGRKNYGNNGGVYTRFHPLYRHAEERFLAKMRPDLDVMRENVFRVPEKREAILKDFHRMKRIFERGCKQNFYGADYGNGPLKQAFDAFYFINEKIDEHNNRIGWGEIEPINLDKEYQEFEALKAKTKERWLKETEHFYQAHEEAFWTGKQTQFL